MLRWFFFLILILAKPGFTREYELKIAVPNTGELIYFQDGIAKGPGVGYLNCVLAGLGVQSYKYFEVPMIRSHESSVLKTFDIVFPYFPEITHEALPSYKIDEIKIMIYSTQPIIHDEKKINFLGIRQALLPLARRSSLIRKISSNFFHLTGRKIVERAVDLLKLKRINGAFLFALHEPYIQDSLNHYYKLDPNISLDMQILINPFVFQKNAYSAYYRKGWQAL